MTLHIRPGRSLAAAIALAITCHSTWASDDSLSGSNPVPACPAIAELEHAPNIDTLQHLLKALHADLVKDMPNDDACDPPLNMTAAMNQATPLCEVMGVNTSAIFLGYTPSEQTIKAPVPAVISYALPYTDDAYQSIITHLRKEGFERVEHDPYPDLTFRKKSPPWEINDFYRRGELYVDLRRDTDFKHFTVAIGSAATIRLMSRDLHSCG